MPSLLQTGGGYFAYATPRCNTERKLGEADQWVLLSKMSEVSAEQLQQLTQDLPHLGESSRASVPAGGAYAGAACNPWPSTGWSGCSRE